MTASGAEEGRLDDREGDREIAFEVGGHRCAFTVPPPGDLEVRTVFLLGLPKAGSTLLARLMTPVTRSAGLTYVAVQDALHRLGVPPKDYPAEVNRAFRPSGYAFGGFRSLPGALALPPYARDRTVLLVRDPRDMLTSLYFSLALSHAPPGAGAGGGLVREFHERRRAVGAMDIDTFALSAADVVAGQYRTVERKLAGIGHRLYRYEDIIFDKAAWAADMVAYLGLEASAAAVARAVAAADQRPAVEDPSAHVRKVTPGDHLEKLKPATIAELNTRLAPVLGDYGYG